MEKSVARLLELDSSPSLPQQDRLADLSLHEPGLHEPSQEDTSDTPVTHTTLDGAASGSASAAPGVLQSPDAFLDWDELEIDHLPTTYRRYLFDLRVQGYLEQTRRELSRFLLPGRF